MLDHGVQFWVLKAKKIYAELSMAAQEENDEMQKTLRINQAQDDVPAISDELTDTERQVFQELSHRFWLGDIPWHDELVAVQDQCLPSRSPDEIESMYRQYIVEMTRGTIAPLSSEKSTPGSSYFGSPISEIDGV